MWNASKQCRAISLDGQWMTGWLTKAVCSATCVHAAHSFIFFALLCLLCWHITRIYYNIEYIRLCRISSELGGWHFYSCAGVKFNMFRVVSCPLISLAAAEAVKVRCQKLFLSANMRWDVLYIYNFATRFDVLLLIFQAKMLSRIRGITINVIAAKSMLHISCNIILA